MKVHTAYEFTDEALRMVRAALGRGGVATRKDCRYFIERCIVQGLKDAPEPRRKRVKLEKPAPAKPVSVCTCEEEGPRCPHCTANRERIARVSHRAAEVL